MNVRNLSIFMAKSGTVAADVGPGASEIWPLLLSQTKLHQNCFAQYHYLAVK